MARLMLAIPAALEERIATEAIRHGHSVVARSGSAAEAAEQLRDIRPDVAIVAAAPPFFTQALLSECDELGIRIVALVALDADRRLAASMGLRETVSAAADWPEIEALLRPVIGRDMPSVSQKQRGRVIAVWGPAGAPGRTTIAISIAAEIAAAGYSVALADVDTHSGAIAPSLGLLDEAPGFAAACRLAGGGALTIDEFERVGQRYWSAAGSFWVLTGIGSPSRWPELSPARVTATLEAARDWVDFTVLDTGFSMEHDEELSSDLAAPRRNGATIAALQSADQVVAVASADPIGLARFLRAYADVANLATTSRISVVANRVRASAIGLNPAVQVEQTLSRFGGVLTVALVPHDQSGFDTAVLTARTITDAAPRSSARLAIARFVASRILPEPAPAGQRWGRRKRRLRAATANN